MHRTVAAEEIEKVHEISSPAAPTPVTDGQRLYVYFGSYGLLCYDLDGNPQWERRPLPENPYGAVASPIVAGELLVLNHQGKEAYLLGVNRRDGRTVWKTDRSLFQYGWSTPVHWCHDGVDEIVVLGGDFQPDQRLMAYNLADGAERWWVAGLPPCGKSTPVIGGGLLFLAAPDIIMEPAAEKRNPERAAQFYAGNAARVLAVRPGGKGDVSQTHIAWSERKGVPGVPSPLYYDGRLYSFMNGGIVFCRDAKTGKLVYSGRLEVMGEYYSSPVAAGHRVYIASAEGVVVVLDAACERMTEEVVAVAAQCRSRTNSGPKMRLNRQNSACRSFCPLYSPRISQAATCPWLLSPACCSGRQSAFQQELRRAPLSR